VAAQDLGADGVEGAEPGHALAGGADQRADPVLHLPGGLVGEGHRQDVEGARPPGGDQVGGAGGQHPGLAGAGAGQHEDRALRGLDGAALLGIKPLEIAGGVAAEGAHGAGGDGRGGRAVPGGLRLRAVLHPASLDQIANGVEAVRAAPGRSAPFGARGRLRGAAVSPVAADRHLCDRGPTAAAERDKPPLPRGRGLG
jgi:hypothetical protein